LKMTDGAAETVRILKQKGNQIYIITGRAHTKEKGVVGFIFRKMLKYWLRKNKFVYDKIFYVTEEGSSEEKYNICIQENIDVLVDDKPTNLLPLKDKLKIVCFPAKWNEDNHDLDKYRIKCFEDLLNV
jgi:dTDP-D-glucose 4,6-dehydratase